MRESTDLFDLIKTLSKSEKRYFKVNAEKDSIYVRLFDAIDSMKSYDEVFLKKKYSAAAFIKNLPYNKVYLYNELLSSVTRFNEKNSIDGQIRELISKIEVLIHKGLLKQAGKLINKTYDLAAENEKHSYLLLILNSKANLKTLLRNPDEREAFTEEISWEQYKLHEQMMNQAVYYRLAGRIIKFMNTKGGIRSEKDRKEVMEILNDKLLSDISYAKNLDSKCYFYFTRHLCYLSLGEINDAYSNSIKGIELLEHADMNKSQMRGRLRTALGSHLLLLKYFPEKEKEFINSLKKYRDAIFPDRYKIPGRFIDSYNSEILFNIRNGNFRENTLILAELDNLQELKDYRKVSEYFFLSSNAAYSEFICGNYAQSLKWLNIALYEKDNAISHKAITLTMILSLILHYELKNYELLEYQMISTYRYLIRRKRLFKYESLALNFIRSSVKNISEIELRERFDMIRIKLIEISSDPNEASAFEDFDLISWLESKIWGIPFNEVLKRKIQKIKTN